MTPEEIAQALSDLQTTDQGYRVEIDDAARRLHSTEDSIIAINGSIAALTTTVEANSKFCDAELDAVDARFDAVIERFRPLEDLSGHDHDIDFEMPDLHFNGKVANVAYNVLALASTVIGFAGASGQIDHLAIGGLVVGPILLAFKRYIDSQTAVKTTAALAAASAPKAGCPCS